MTFWGNSLQDLAGLDAFVAGEADSIAGLEAVDDHTVRITVNQPALTLLDTLRYIGILPAYVLGDAARADLSGNRFFIERPFGAGPFKAAEANLDQFIRLERNENYLRGAPRIEGINMFFLDGSIIPAGLETGDINMSSNVGAEDLPRFPDDEAAMIPIRLGKGGWVSTSKLRNATPQNFGHLPNYNAIETWWLEE